MAGGPVIHIEIPHEALATELSKSSSHMYSVGCFADTALLVSYGDNSRWPIRFGHVFTSGDIAIRRDSDIAKTIE
jgi:hypothetical protein